jgi:hypothetical protein
MVTVKTFCISVLSLVLVNSSSSYPFESLASPEAKAATLISSTVVAELSGNKIDVKWDSLSKGNRLEVTVNGFEKSFFNVEGQISEIPALSGENSIEVSEVQPLTKSVSSVDSEKFETRNIILGSAADAFSSGNSAYGAISLPTTTRLRYQTFIREKYIEVDASSNCIPFLTFGERIAFGGDYRSFSPDSARYRTKFDVRIDWLSNGNQVATTDVGESKTYKWNEKLLTSDKWVETGSMTQSTSGMGLTTLSQNSSLVHFKMSHSIRDPFCIVVNPISYDLDVYVSRAGTYTIVGTRNRVPDHELYIRTNVNTNWSVIYQRHNYSYRCLWPVYTDWNCNTSPNLQSIDF